MKRRNGERSASNSSCAALPRKSVRPSHESQLVRERARELRQYAPEAITGSADRFHQRIMFGGFERLAQPAYVHVDRPFLHEDVIAPDLVEQLGAAVDALRMGHEEIQHPELGRAEIDVAAGGADAMRDRIEPEVRDLDDVLGELRS